MTYGEITISLSTEMKDDLGTKFTLKINLNIASRGESQ